MRGSKPGKNVQLQENEIRGLCLKSREIFLSQPILLELEAPLKICGEYCDFDLMLGGGCPVNADLELRTSARCYFHLLTVELINYCSKRENKTLLDA